MFIEVKGKPKTVIIQKLTKANKWVDIGSITILRGIDFKTANEILSSCATLKTPHRLIIRGKKSKREFQVLSSRSEDFYNVISLMARDNRIHLMVDGSKMVANNLNPYCINLDGFIALIRSYGGIAKANLRPTCKDDGNLSTFDIKYVNGIESTVSVFYS